MGINVTNNTSSQELRVIAGSAITAGDLVVNSEYGSVFPAASGLTIAQNNNTTTGITAISAVASQAAAGTGGSSGYSRCIAQLSNGTIAFAYPGNGTTATTGVTLRFKNLQGGDDIAPITVTSDTSVVGLNIIALGSNVLVSWINSATVKFAIYTSAGVVVKAATTVINTGVSTVKGWDVAALATGDFVFAYRKVTSNDLEFQRYDSTGTAAGSAVTVEAASTPFLPTILVQSSGDFVIYYYRTAATAAYKFARYDATGTLQGSLTTVFTTSVYLSSAIPNSGIIELSNGNFVVMACTTSTAYPAFYIYSATGTLVSGANNFGGTSNAYAYAAVSPAMCATSNGFAICSRGNGAYNYLYTYSNTGANIINGVQVPYSALLTATSASEFFGGILIDNGGAGFALLQSSYASPCSSQYASAIWTFSTSGAVVGTPILLRSSSVTSPVYSRWAIKTSDGTFVTSDALSGVETFGTYAIARKSVVGVAQESAATAGTLRVSTQGTYNINSSHSAGGNFDQRTATVPGARGTVAGSTAVLFGMS